MTHSCRCGAVLTKKIDAGDGRDLLTHRWTGRDDSVGGAFALDPGVQARYQACSLDFALGRVERALANFWDINRLATETHSNRHYRTRFDVKSGWWLLESDGARDDGGRKHARFFHPHFEAQVMHPPSRLFQVLLNEVGHRQSAPVNGVYQCKPEHDSGTRQEEQGGQDTFRHRRKP